MTTYDNVSASGTDADLLNPTITGWAIAYTVAVLFNAVLTLLKESYPAVHDLLVALTGHHWASQGLLDIIVFVVLGVLLARSGKQMSGPVVVWSIAGSTVVAGLVIVGFFLF